MSRPLAQLSGAAVQELWTALAVAVASDGLEPVTDGSRPGARRRSGAQAAAGAQRRHGAAPQDPGQTHGRRQRGAQGAMAMRLALPTAVPMAPPRGPPRGPPAPGRRLGAAAAVACRAVRRQLCLAPLAPAAAWAAAPPPAPQVVRKLWGQGLSEGEDLEKWREALAEDCVPRRTEDGQFREDSHTEPRCSSIFTCEVYEDLYYSEAAKGKEAVLSLLKEKLLPKGARLVLDSISDGRSSCGFAWHVQGDAIGLRGLCYLRLNAVGQVAYVRDLGEPVFKAGELTEKLLEALTKDQAPTKERVALSGPPKTPRRAGDIVRYLYGDVQKAGGDAIRFYADDVVYEAPTKYVTYNNIHNLHNNLYHI